MTVLNSQNLPVSRCMADMGAAVHGSWVLQCMQLCKTLHLEFVTYLMILCPDRAAAVQELLDNHYAGQSSNYNMGKDVSIERLQRPVAETASVDNVQSYAAAEDQQIPEQPLSDAEAAAAAGLVAAGEAAEQTPAEEEPEPIHIDFAKSRQERANHEKVQGTRVAP